MTTLLFRARAYPSGGDDLSTGGIWQALMDQRLRLMASWSNWSTVVTVRELDW